MAADAPTKGPLCPKCKVETVLFGTAGVDAFYWCDFCDYEVVVRDAKDS